MDKKEAPSVLLVEDDQTLLRMLANMLTQRGITVHEAKNGLEGVAQIIEHKPDLMLLDIDMPDMDGITLLRSLKQDMRMVPTIMLTNLNIPNLIADAAELGVSEYLIKSSWEIDAIGNKIEEKLHMSRS